MPMYDYKYTDEQGGTFDTFQHMSESAHTEHEGRPCERTVQAFRPVTNFGEGNGCEPIEMMSIAVDSPEEIVSFRQRNPGVEISDVPGDPRFGIPVARSRREKLRILEKEGFVETN